jgi:hypothetical protein
MKLLNRLILFLRALRFALTAEEDDILEHDFRTAKRGAVITTFVNKEATITALQNALIRNPKIRRSI